MKARHIIVRLPAEGIGAEVTGYGSRTLLEEITGRPPIYNTRTRAWCCRVKTARNLIALAEARGYVVELGEVA